MDQPINQPINQMSDQERLKRIDELLQQAMALKGEELREFLDRSCAGDAELRREVESMLRGEVDTSEILKYSRAAGWRLPARAGALRTGEHISHYLIEALLGVGGMGEVYLAEDVRLGRKVALKLLPLQFTADPERVKRFEREARAASALNHQNIITIYDIGQDNGLHFIAAELVVGQTLRQKLGGEPMTPREAVAIASQIAAGLAAAHEAGVVHRDIKPENVMARADGQVKILDFGLAKLIDYEPSLQDTPAKFSGDQNQTRAGSVMGTPRYMSPEQALGEDVDHRADLFSLGVVLFEMAAGRAPFEGATNTEILASILEKEPPKLKALSPEAPERFEMILSRALRKERTERYQTAREMIEDLKRLKQELELETLTEHAAPNAESTARDSPPGAGAKRARIRNPRSAILIVVALAIVVSGLIGWGSYRLIGSHQVPDKTIKMTKLTTLGIVRAAAISPDGRRVAYSAYEYGQSSLWVREVATTDSIPILPPADGDEYYQMTFSPDGRDLFYVKYEEDRDLRALYRVPALGGSASRILDHVDSSIAFSPDGAQFAFVRYDRDRKESSLVVARTSGGGERKLVTRRDPELLAYTLQRVAPPGPLAWSPDGEIIAYAVGTEGASNDSQIWSVPATGGTERLLLPQKWWGVSEVAWLGDGSGLLLLARDEQFAPPQIWRLPLSNGEPRRLTNDPDGYASLSVTADAHALAAVQLEEALSIWVASAVNPRDATRILYRKSDGRWGLSWTTDGKILYDSKASGRQEIWIMDADGGNRLRMTSGAAADDAPVVSPDGRYIIYASLRRVNEITHIWRMDRDGSNPKQLTFGKGEYAAYCSPDGRWIVYGSLYDGKTSVWKTTIDGGDPARMTADDTEDPYPAISPDGRFLAYYRGLGNEKKQIEIIPFSGGPPVKIIKVPETAYLLKWAPDGRALTYANTVGGVTNIWRRPLNGDPPKQLTFFETDLITRFDWSRDGARFVCGRMANYQDVILINLD